jgi:prophage regulatory protein
MEPIKRPLISLREVKNLTTLGRTTIYKLEREGRFPKRVSVERHVAWRLDQVQAWIDALPVRDPGQ